MAPVVPASAGVTEININAKRTKTPFFIFIFSSIEIVSVQIKFTATPVLQRDEIINSDEILLHDGIASTLVSGAELTSKQKDWYFPISKHYILLILLHEEPQIAEEAYRRPHAWSVVSDQLGHKRYHPIAWGQ